MKHLWTWLPSAWLCLTAVALADTYPRQPGVDALHYAFQLTLSDDTDEIVGQATVEVQFNDRAVSPLVLDLASVGANDKGMQVDAVRCGEHQVAHVHAENRLSIPLDPRPRAGERRSFTIHYRGVPGGGLRIGKNKFDERTFYAMNWPNLAHQWLPMIDHPSDKATSEFLITAPAHYQVVSNGLLVEQQEAATGNRLTHWKQSVPIASWLNTIGVARFAVHQAEPVRGIPLQVWVAHQELPNGIVSFEEPARRAIEFYCDYIGPYPYEKLANIAAPGMNGGMEHASAIFYGERSVTGRPATSLVAHEVAHQWFGNSVTESDWDDVWLSEGFATYFALLTAEHYQGREAYRAGLARSRETILNLEKRTPSLTIVHDNLADMRKVIDQLKYQKGAWTLHMLRGLIGPEIFQSGIREYYRRYRDQNASTADFQRVMEQASGRELDWFFAQWLRRPGSPVIAGVWNYNTGAKVVEIELTQTQAGAPFRLPMEVALTLPGVDRPRVEKIELNAARQTFKFQSNQAPTSLALDPDALVLMTATLEQPPGTAPAEAAAKAEPADLLFTGGNIYTVDDRRPKAEAVAIKQGKILAVGTNAELLAHRGDATRVIDLAGQTMLPGLIDAHCHLSGVGEREMTLNLEGTTSKADFLAMVRARVEQAKPGEWVTGRGWIETFWNPQAFPTCADLDSIAPNNPVWLTRADGHGSVANSAAIRLAGVTKDTAAPFGGEIMKDKQSGEPNGMFLDNAQGLIARLVPPTNAQQLSQALVLGAEHSVRLGWTGLQVPSSSYRELDALQKLYGEGRIPLRVDLAMLGPGNNAARLLQEGPLLDAFDGRLSCRAIKVSFDGALGSKGAALLDKYADHDTAGFLKWKSEELLPMFEASLRTGVQIWTHAIGDRSNREILNLYEQAFRNVPGAERKVRDPRWRVEHAQIVQASDIPRFAALGVLPSMQPSHAIGDLHFAASRLGLDRLSGAYAWQSFLKSGSIIAGGSDAPVERGEPMVEYYAAVSRRDLQGFSGEGWHPEQAVSREQALKMYTIWAAQAAFQEANRGSIEPGKFADLTVLDRDILTIPLSEIPTTKCQLTIVNGQIVYDAKTAKP